MRYRKEIPVRPQVAVQLTSADPNPAKVLIVSLAEDLGKVGDEAMAKINAERQQGQAKVG